jgi:phenylalanine-4-hydroxylase
MARIYLSSTFGDLSSFRKAAYRVLRQLGHDVIAMEDVGATDQLPLEKAKADIAACDVYIGIIAWRYGYIPEKDNPSRKSIIELEYEEAGKYNIPRLIFLLDEDATWPVEMLDASTGGGERGNLISRFRDRLKTERIVSFFKTEDELARLVITAVSQLRLMDEPEYSLTRTPLSPIADAYDRIVNFARRFGEPHITLAMHAALPLGLTAELVHLIRANFVASAPMIAEADLLLSPLCREVGGESYEMYPEVRELLLAELNEDEAFGAERVKELADFLMVYATRHLKAAHHPELRDFLAAQLWTALAHRDPAEAARSLAEALQHCLTTPTTNPVGSLRLAQLARTMNAQLVGQDHVLSYAAGIEHLARGDVSRAAELFDNLGPLQQAPVIKSITLPAPAGLTQWWPEAAEDSAAGRQTQPALLPPHVSLRNQLSGHNYPIRQVAWSPDGKQLASGTDDQIVQVWDAERGLLLRTLEGHTGEVNSVAWSPDSRQLVSASSDSEVRLWATDSGMLISRFLGHSAKVNDAAWSPDGKLIASGSDDQTVRVWDARSGKLLRTLEGQAEGVSSVAWSPAGAAYLIAGYQNGEVIAWDTDSGKIRHRYQGHSGMVNSVAISPGRAIFASGADDGTIRIWRIDEPADNFQLALEEHTAGVTRICFSGNGRLLASRANDGTVRLWNSANWQCVAVIVEAAAVDGHPPPHASVLAFHPRALLLATCIESAQVVSVLEIDEQALLSAPGTPEQKTEQPSERGHAALNLIDELLRSSSPENALVMVTSDHPGLRDPDYRKRRDFITNLAKQYREDPEHVIPTVDYTPQETAVWRFVYDQLKEAHQRYACSLYLDSKRELDISRDRVPQLRALDEKLNALSNFRLAPVEGLVEPRVFLRWLGSRVRLCTQYLRHHARPDYTPEPDVVYEVIGQIPYLTDPDLADLLQSVGQGALTADEERLEQLSRLYWFTIECGLLEEGNEIKAFGAKLLSSLSELEHVFGHEVERRKFDLQEVINTAYDYTNMQPVLFVLPSYSYLKEVIREFIEAMARRPSA